MLRLSEARFYEKLMNEMIDNGASKENAMEYMLRKFDNTLTIKQILDERYMKLFGKKDEHLLKGEWMLTIRPSNDMPLHKFIEFSSKLFEKKIFGPFKYVYEQKGECLEELGNGKHLHAICNLIYSNKGIKWHINEIMRLVKKMNIEDFVLPNSIHLRKINNEKDMEYANNYIDPHIFGKHNEHKKKSWEMDGEWRKRHHLLPIYDGNIVPSKQARGTMEQYISIS